MSMKRMWARAAFGSEPGVDRSRIKDLDRRAEALASHAASMGWGYSEVETDEVRDLLARFSDFLDRERGDALGDPPPHLSNVIRIGGEGACIACDSVAYHLVESSSGPSGGSSSIVVRVNPIVLFADTPEVPAFTYRPKRAALQILQAFGLKRRDGNVAPRRLAAAGRFLRGPDGPAVGAAFDDEHIVGSLVGAPSLEIESDAGALLFRRTPGQEHVDATLRLIATARDLADTLLRRCRGAGDGIAGGGGGGQAPASSEERG